MHHPSDPEPPDFTPVPLARSRKDGWTPERQRLFINALQSTGMVAAAAQAAGMGVTSAYNLRRRPGAESFAHAWDMAEREAQDRAQDALIEHFTHGAKVPRFYRGRLVGWVHGVAPHIERMALRVALGSRRQQPGQAK